MLFNSSIEAESDTHGYISDFLSGIQFFKVANQLSSEGGLEWIKHILIRRKIVDGNGSQQGFQKEIEHINSKLAVSYLYDGCFSRFSVRHSLFKLNFE